MQDIKQLKQVNLLNTGNIKHVIVSTKIINMQDINRSELREMINHKHERFRGLSHLLYVPAFTAMKDFHYNRSCKITRYCNTYNGLPQELLDPQVPHLFPQEQHTRTCKLVEDATSTTPPNKNLNTW